MSQAVRRALYGKLAGDGTLTGLLAAPVAGYAQSIYYQQAPQGARFPYVIFSKQSGLPRETFGLPSAFETDVWLVKGVDQSESADTAEAIQARLAALLNDANLSISGRQTMYLRRESDVDYDEVDDGEQYRHSGSLFRLMHQQ